MVTIAGRNCLDPSSINWTAGYHYGMDQYFGTYGKGNRYFHLPEDEAELLSMIDQTVFSAPGDPQGIGNDFVGGCCGHPWRNGNSGH